MHIAKQWSAVLFVMVGCAPAAQEAQAPAAGNEGDANGNPTNEEVDPVDAEATEPTDADADADQESQAAKTRRRNVTADSPIEDIMAVHYYDAEQIRKAVIDGDPQAAGKPAASLVQLFDVDKLPQAWVEPAKRMQASAQRVQDNSDIAGVAAAVADIGTSCGWCHQKLGGPQPAVGEPPAEDGSLKMRMKRHIWATERLWEGLYVPSGGAWKAGAAVLTDAPFPSEVLQEGGVYAKNAAKELEQLSAEAPKKQTADQRAALFAKLLGTCATCHLAMEK